MTDRHVSILAYIAFAQLLIICTLLVGSTYQMGVRIAQLERERIEIDTAILNVIHDTHTVDFIIPDGMVYAGEMAEGDVVIGDGLKKLAPYVGLDY